MNTRSWVEISRDALRANVRTLRVLVGRDRVLCAVVKANAYGHGIREVARTIARETAFIGKGPKPLLAELTGAGWFGVDSLSEAELLRAAHLRHPILILGYIPIADARAAVRIGAQVTVAAHETVHALAAAARSIRQVVPVHVKVETGTQRQGVMPRELPAFVRLIEQSHGLALEGISTHLADVEDTGPGGFARVQIERFDRAVAIAERIVGRRLLRHASASAGAMLLPDARFDLVRCGISLYGLWPSDERRGVMERTSATTAPSPSHSPSRREGEKKKGNFPTSRWEGGRGGEGAPVLRSVLTWKTIVGPMHWAAKGTPVGYGCTERVRRRTRIAVLPVGYWDGYDRGLSSIGEVLIRGRRCKVIGRVCMNMIMVDATDVPRVRLEDEVVLIGRQGHEEITVEELAEKIETINYEIVTRINSVLPRKVV